MEKPFKPLEPFTEGSLGGFSIIEQAKENPDLLVKRIAFLIEQTSEEGYDLDLFKKEVVEPIQFLKDNGLEKFMPAVQPIWGKNESGKEVGYLITKKVEGQDIQSIKHIEEEVVKELDELLARSLNIEAECLLAGKDIISPDLIYALREEGPEIHNIIIGKIKGDEGEHPYMVDFYPVKSNQDYLRAVSLEYIREMWLEAIKKLSAKGNGYTFPATIQALEGYMSALSAWKKDK